MAIADDRRRANRAFRLVGEGATAQQALATIAAEDGITGAEARASIRKVRYLITHPTNPRPLLDEYKPPDVVRYEWGWSPGKELAQQRIMAVLGLAGIPSLPCLLGWHPSWSYVDGDGVTVTIPAGYEAVRISDAKLDDWEDDTPPADRARRARDWLRKRFPPAFVDE